MIEKNISSKIQNQFPGIYREEADSFVCLLKDYYSFLETNVNQSHYHSRRLLDYRNIDTTISDMVLLFRKKFMDGLPSTRDDTFVIKHILDLYRRKGTEEGIKLFFKLFYDKNVTIQYPEPLILKPSDSLWQKDYYLQLYPDDNFELFLDLTGKKIIGSNSLAEAVVDRVLFTVVNNSFIPIIFIDFVQGVFSANEIILSSGINYGKIYGSTTGFDIDLSDPNRKSGNQVGDILICKCNTGFGAKAVVTRVSETFSGEISYSVLNGGWGYSAENSELILNDQVVLATNTNNNIALISTLKKNEKIADQNGNEGEIIHGSNNIIFLKTKDANSIFVSNSIFETTERNLYDKIFFINTTENISPSTESIVDIDLVISAIEAASSNTEPEATLFTQDIGAGRLLGDLNDDGVVSIEDAILLNKYKNNNLRNSTIKTFIEGDFFDYILSSNTYSSYTKIRNTANQYVNYISISEKNDTSPGDTAVISELSNTSNILLIEDKVIDFIDVVLDSNNFYDQSANGILFTGHQLSNTSIANINTVLDDAFELNSLEVGKIVTFTNINPGLNYTFDVKAFSTDSLIKRKQIRNQLIRIAQEQISLLNIGNIITDGTINGEITAINSDYISVLIYGAGRFVAGNTFTYASATFQILEVRTDYESLLYGDNSDINAKTEFAIGNVLEVSILDSGFGYRNGSRVSLYSEETDEYITFGFTKAARGQGETAGFWKTLSSHIGYDSGQRLHDNFYYQTYSYEILSDLDINTYVDFFNTIMHPAGMKLFGNFILSNETNTSIGSSFSLEG